MFTDTRSCTALSIQKVLHGKISLLVAVTRFLPWDETCQHPTKPQKQGHFPGPESEVVKRAKVAKERETKRPEQGRVE